MDSYKKYMDRIRLDEDQHEQLMEAVRKAEAAAAETERAEKAQPSDAKIRRIRLKPLAFIASAAAVIVLVVSVFPGSLTRTKDAAVTAALEDAEYSRNEAALSPAEIADTGLTRAADSSSYEMTKAVSTLTPEVTAVTQATSAPTAVPAASQPEEAPATEKRDFVINKIQEERTGVTATSEAGFVPAETAKNETDTTEAAANAEAGLAAEKILDAVLEMKDRMEEPGTEADGSGEEPDADYGFVLEGAAFTYDSEKGFLRADGLEYALNEAEQESFNALLNEYFSDKK